MKEAPRRPNSHVLGDVGQTEAALVLKKWGWTADFIDSDYGEDLDCNIFVNERRTTLYFRCQVKSSRSDAKYLRFLKSGDISVSIETSLAKFWLTSYYPVLLVVYNEETEEIYWENATLYLRSNLSKLASNKLTIKVSTKIQLAQSRSDVERNIQDFYAQMFRLSTPMMQCNLIPVIMPGYKILEPMKFYDALDVKHISEKICLNIEPVCILPEYLPAWTTILRSMDLNYFHCWEIRLAGTDLETFENRVIEFIQWVSTENNLMLSCDQWIAFIYKPIRIIDRDAKNFSAFSFNQEVTGWWSYCYLDGLRSDHSYVFALPNNCLLARKYHGFSWDFYHSIVPDKDLAINFTGRIPITPAYAAEKKLFKSFILSQFLPWSCSANQVDFLREMLAPLRLQFCEIPDLFDNENKVGAICDYMFNPNFGLVNVPKSWNLLENNSILERLRKDFLIEEIPGTQECLGVTEFVLAFFEDSIHTPEYLQIQSCDCIPGLPVDHSGRRISVQRYRIVDNFDEEKINNNLIDCRIYLESNLDSSQDVEVCPYLFEDFGTKICVLSVNWRPNLHESSLESFERFSEIIFQFFNKAIPEDDLDERDYKSTRDILERRGTIIFDELSENLDV